MPMIFKGRTRVSRGEPTRLNLRALEGQHLSQGTRVRLLVLSQWNVEDKPLPLVPSPSKLNSRDELGATYPSNTAAVESISKRADSNVDNLAG
jgi:hypothetical protein